MKFFNCWVDLFLYNIELNWFSTSSLFPPTQTFNICYVIWFEKILSIKEKDVKMAIPVVENDKLLVKL